MLGNSAVAQLALAQFPGNNFRFLQATAFAAASAAVSGGRFSAAFQATGRASANMKAAPGPTLALRVIASAMATGRVSAMQGKAALSGRALALAMMFQPITRTIFAKRTLQNARARVRALQNYFTRTG